MDSKPDAQDKRELRIGEYLDRSMNEAERRAFERQAEGDPELARLIEQYKVVDGLVGDWGQRAPEVDWDRFEAGVRHRRRALDVSPQRQRLVIRFLVPMSAAAAILLALALWRTVSPIDETPRQSVQRIASVVVERPVAGPAEDWESHVSYSYVAEEVDEKLSASAPMRPMIAKAVAGGPVRWSGFGRAPSAS